MKPSLAARASFWPFLLPAVASASVRGLWAPDEPRYAEVAREIWTGSGLLVMRLCGEVYPDKPPLLFWVSGLVGKLAGWSELALRVPSLLATAGTAALIALLARRFWGRLEAFWAPVIFLTFGKAMEIGGRLQIDPLLTFLTLAAIVLLPHEEPGTGRPRGNLLLAGLLTGLAVLAKGPVAIVIVGAVAVAWRFVPGSGQRPRTGTWLAALGLAILPAALWAAAASWSEPALGRQLFFEQHAGRVVSDNVPHAGPFWKPTLGLVLLLLPWTPLVIVGLVRAVRSYRGGGDPGLSRALLWFGVLLVFFSAIPPKRDLYLLPAYPALALIAGREVAHAVKSAHLPRAVGPSLVGLFGVISVAMLAFAAFHARLVPELGSVVPRAGLRLAVAAVPALLATWFGLQALRRNDPGRWAGSVAGGVLGLGLAIALLLFVPIDRVKSTETIAHELALRPERPVTMPCVGVRPEGFRFYAQLPTVLGGLEEALDREGDFLALIDQDDWERLAEAQRARMQVLFRRPFGGHDVLICGRAPEEKVS